MACKLLIVLTAFLVVSCSGVAIGPRITDSHNINQCANPTTATVRLLETNIYDDGKLILPVERTITFPEAGLGTHIITCIQVIDMDTSNHGGYPDIISGGVGSNEVKISLKSQWGQPLNFRIEIWADV